MPPLWRSWTMNPPDGHRLHRMHGDADSDMADAGRGAKQDHLVLCGELRRLQGHGLFPPPTLRERRQRGLARRLVASARAYVGFVRANVAEYDITEVCHRSRGRPVIRCPI
jgi:hypothetical protein